MTNRQLQELLRQYPDDMLVKLLIGHNYAPPQAEPFKPQDPIDFSSEKIILTSETAYVNENAPEEEWDTEGGKIELGDGQQYLLINPIIL